MAGTRLVIQATLFVELIVLVGIAAYFGLCRTGDVLCTPLLHQTGRSQLILPLNLNEKQVFESTLKHSKQQLRRYNLHFTLVLEDASEWNQWAPALDAEISSEQQNLVQQYPCLVGQIETNLILDGTLSNNAYIVDNIFNETEYRVSSSTIKTWLTKSRRNHFDQSRLDVLVYVPVESKSPLTLKLGHDLIPATALTYEKLLLSVVKRQQRVDDNNEDGSADNNAMVAVKDALAFVDPFLNEQCQLIFSNATKWWQQLVHDTYERAKKQVLINHDLLSKSSLKVPITKEVAQQWRKSEKLMDEAERQSQHGNYLHAVELLEESVSISQSLLSDPTLMEPIDMQNDHYMAVFFPLVFPLMLPFLAGLIREVKRYRKLKRGEQ